MITKPLLQALVALCDGPVHTAVRSAGLVTLRAGGPVAVVVEPHSVAAARRLWSLCHREGVPAAALGKGSNTLVVDAGFPGVLFRLAGALARVSCRSRTLTAGAAAAQPVVARMAAARGLSGAEFLVGIPGTMGGAACMNAGCHGQEMADCVAEVTSITATGAVLTRPARECDFAYRQSVFQQEPELIVGVRLQLAAGDGSRIADRLRQNLAERKARQPLRYPNCGSVFKNPPAGAAWQFIAAAGQGGRQCGKAQVSRQHSNFIINRGGATATDILTLLRAVQEKVRLHAGVTLAPELVVR